MRGRSCYGIVEICCLHDGMFAYIWLMPPGYRERETTLCDRFDALDDCRILRLLIEPA